MLLTRIRAASSVVLIACVLACVQFSYTHADAACGNGKHMSTTDDVAKGLPANTCVDDSISTYLSGGCGSNPYDMLQSGGYIGNAQVRPVASGSGVSDAALRQGIDPALACRLFKFFEATRAKGCSVKIISAYRSAALQESMCGAGRSGCAAAGRSCHQYGLAVDVQTSCIGWMRAAAPQFQLVFPYYGQHIQCAEHPVAACSPATKPCNGGVQITPDLSRIPPPSQVPDTYFQPPATVPQNPFQNPNSPFSSNVPVAPPPYNPQAQVPVPNTQQNPIPSTPIPSSPQPNGVDTAPRFTPTFPLPIPNTPSSTPILPFTYTSSTRVVNTAETIPAVTDRTPTPTYLNDDLRNSVNINDTSGYTTSGGLAINSTDDTQRDADQPHVTETFTRTEPTKVAPPASATTSASASNSLIVAALTALRDLLVSYVNLLIKARSSVGFQAPWQFPSQTFVDGD